MSFIRCFLCILGLIGVVEGAIAPGTVYVLNRNDASISVVFMNAVIGTIVLPDPDAGPSVVAFTPDYTRAYVLGRNNATVYIIDTSSSSVIQSIVIPNGPRCIAMAGTKVLVGDDTSANVTVFEADALLTTIPLTGGGMVRSIAVTPDNSIAYAAHGSGADSRVSVIDVATNTESLALNSGGDEPSFLALTPDGTKAFVTNTGSSNISVYNSTSVIAPSILAGTSRSFIAVAPDGLKAYAVNTFDNSVTPFSTSSPFTADPDILVGGNQPFFMAITSDGATAYLGHQKTNLVNAIDLQTNTVTDIAVNDNVPQLSISSDDSEVFVVCGELDIISTATNTVTQQVIVGSGPIWLTLTPFQVSPPLLLTHVRLSPTPQGYQIVNRFLTGGDLINVITWSAPTGGFTPVSYEIYRNAELTELVAEVSASGILEYKDHNRKKNTVYTYYIIALNSTGNVLTVGNITVVPN